MFCPECGTELKQQENGALYCKSCNRSYKSDLNTGVESQNEAIAKQTQITQQNSLHQEKNFKVCPVCSKIQSSKNNMCIHCGYDFISETEYVKPAKKIKSTNVSHANTAITASSARRNKALSAMCVLVSIFAVLLVVAIVSTALYCSAPITYGQTYTMNMKGGVFLPSPSGWSTSVSKLTIEFYGNNTYKMTADDRISVFGFYYINQNDIICLDNPSYGISHLDINGRNQLYVTNSEYFGRLSNFMCSQGIDVFLITATVVIGVAEITFIILLCIFAAKRKRINL